MSDIKKTKPKMSTKCIRFPDDLWSRIERIAIKNDVTPSDVVRHAVEKLDSDKN